MDSKLNVSQFKDFHLNLWQEFNKKSFILQFIALVYFVNYCFKYIDASPFYILIRLGTIIGIYLLILKPILGIFVLIFFISGFLVSDVLPRIPFLRLGSIHTTDLILAGCLALTIIRKFYYKFFYQKDYPFIRTPIDIPLLLFFIMCIIALINGIYFQKADFNIAFRTFRMLSYYLVFFLITNLIRERKDLNLLMKGVYSIALITSIVTILQSVLGTSMPIKFIGRIETLETGTTRYTGVIRSIPEGLFLIFFSFISLGCIVSTRKFNGKTIFWGIAVIILGAGLLFTFYRVTWLSALFSFFLFILLSPIVHKGKFISYSFISFTILISFIFLTPSERLEKIISASRERITSVFRVRGLKGEQADTLKTRMKEIEYALIRIKNYPLFGIGLGTYYKPIKVPWFYFGKRSTTSKDQKETKKEFQVSSPILAEDPSKFSQFLMQKELLIKPKTEKVEIKARKKGRALVLSSPYEIKKIKIPVFHNSFFDIIMRFGLVGAIPYYWLTVLTLMRGFRNWKKVKDPFLRILCLGSTVSYAGILLNALTEPLLLNWRGSIPIPLIWAINEVIYRLENVEEKKLGNSIG